jgi:uncharacterized protein (DUF849 family)
VLLKACLNGPRRPGDHPALPVTPAELAAAAAGAVAAGAGALHVHPKDASGADSLDRAAVSAAVTAVRAAAPGVPVGVTTGAWAATDPEARRAAVRGWTVRPDFASVNWHEPGSVELATDLLDRDIGVEAGLWTPDAVRDWLAWPYRRRCLRVLLEVMGDDAPSPLPAATGEPAAGSPSERAAAAVGRLLDALGPEPGVPVLLHGEGAIAWPVLREAGRRGLDARIGLEDTLVLPDGSPAPDNAALVTAAHRLLAPPSSA